MWIFAGILCGVAIVALAAGAAVLGRRLRQRFEVQSLANARVLFHRRREWLEARFLTLNRGSGRPRGLMWVDCEFADEVCFARDKHSNELRALVAVTIRFEAVEGGGMEDNPNVANLRSATSVFHFNGAEWTTDGRTVFNKNPVETIRHFQNELEVVE